MKTKAKAKPKAPPRKDFISERFGDCIRVTVPMQRTKDWEFWCLLTADRHWDNPHSDRSFQKEHLEECEERRGCWVDLGDTFCLMQGKYDKRASKHCVRPEHQVDNYLDAVIDTAVDWFAPYAHRCVFISHGNHEDSIMKRHETDMTERLIGGLNLTTGSSILRGGFVNMTMFRFQYAGGDHVGARHVLMASDHGWGGGGPVTLDMIQHQRRAAITDADIVVSGHTHDAWMAERMKLHVGVDGKVKHRTQLHLKVPTYKDEYGTGKGGWHVETGKPPKPQGAWWLKFTYDRKRDVVKYLPVRAA